jgi:pimeloyl-ACP methyl ester carboxylesterase
MASKKSTNVRSLQRLLGGLAALSPRLAARLAARWFFRTARRPFIAREAEVLDAGERRDLVVDGERIATWTWGEGPAVLLVHGWGGSAGQMHAFVDPLVAAGMRVVAFDAPAHGVSGGSWLSMPRYAAALASVVNEIGAVTAIITHSFGGAAAALAASQGLEVDRIVQVSPPADALVWFENYARLLGLSPEVTALARRRIEVRVGVSFDRLNARVIGPRVPQPMLVIHDEEDKEVPWADGATVAAFAPGATTHWTRGLGHRRILLDPDVVARAVAFVTEDVERDLPLHELEIELRDRAIRWERMAAA